MSVTAATVVVEDPPWVTREAVANSSVKAKTQAIFEEAIRSIDAIEKGQQSDGVLASDALEQERVGKDSKSRPRLWMMGATHHSRRIAVLIREKGLQDEIEQIWVQPGPTGMRDPPGKPPGPVPILELRPPSKDGLQPGEYFYHPTGIAEYIEGRWPAPISENQNDGRGVEIKALIQDRMAYVDEIVMLGNNYTFNASAVFTSKPSSRDAAASYWRACNETLASLEKLCDPVGPFLVPGCASEPTLVDISLFTWIQNFRYVFGVDILSSGHDRALKMYEAFEQRPSALHDETLGTLWLDRTRSLSPTPEEVPWKVYEFPRESIKKPLLDSCTIKQGSQQENQ
ncbi:hypothetical protein PRZ48_005339 [Zasmidium cellare]|uniref:Glutathione S-transferase n=1 Tax=Zasmidium cellare TaxID=395010 RepID=A0ABR0ETB7_ZASCE|nr:hypothetical protein PRZ48_005339 [Zasmidium cellare]